MVFGELGEDFAVKLNVCFFKLMNELAVGNIVLARRRVNFDVPEFAEITLLFSAIMKRVSACVEQRFARGAFFCFALPTKPLRLAKDFSASF